MEFEVDLSYQKKTPFGVKEFLILKSNTASNTKNSERERYFINLLDKDILEGFLR